MRGVQYLVDDRGARRAVVIDFRKQGELWEDFYDRAVAESRRDEPASRSKPSKPRSLDGEAGEPAADYRPRLRHGRAPRGKPGACGCPKTTRRGGSLAGSSRRLSGCLRHQRY